MRINALQSVWKSNSWYFYKLHTLFAKCTYIFNCRTFCHFILLFSMKCYFLQYRSFMEITRISHGAEAILWAANNCWDVDARRVDYNFTTFFPNDYPNGRALSGYRRMFIGTFALLKRVKFSTRDKCKLKQNLRYFITCWMCNKTLWDVLSEVHIYRCNYLCV